MVLSKEWIIGFTEGEGCFCCQKQDKREYPIFVIANNDKEILEEIQKTLGIGKIYLHDSKPLREKIPTLPHHWALVVYGLRNNLRILEYFDGNLKTQTKIKQFEKWKTYFSLAGNLGNF